MPPGVDPVSFHFRDGETWELGEPIPWEHGAMPAPSSCRVTRHSQSACLLPGAEKQDWHLLRK